MFLLGLDEHRATLGLDRLTNQCNLYFLKSDAASLLAVEPHSHETIANNVTSPSPGSIAPTMLASTKPTEKRHSLNERLLLDEVSNASAVHPNSTRIQLPLFSETKTIELRNTLRSTKFPISRATLYNLNKCIQALDYLENVLTNDTDLPPNLKLNVNRKRWMAAIRVIIENWQDWVSFVQLKHQQRAKSQEFRSFDLKLRKALEISITLSDSDRFEEDPPKYRRFIDCGTHALEKWLSDILIYDPDAF